MKLIEKIHQHLVSKFLWPKDVDVIIADLRERAAITDRENPRRRPDLADVEFDGQLEGNPPFLVASLFVVFEGEALEWLKTNKPNSIVAINALTPLSK